ncbi:MAG: C45 family autoproteolytic acyltransferase/hydrolase [Victivallaceae bacterium]
MSETTLEIAHPPAPPRNRWKRIRFICYGVLLFGLITIFLIPGGQVRFRQMVWSYLPAPAPHVLEVSGVPRERGLAMGEKFKWEIRLLDKIYIRSFAPPETFPKYRKQATELFNRIPVRWKDEVEAMAKASGVDAATLKLGNSFLDMGLNASGCRQIHVDTGSSMLHAHNLDWDNLGGIGNYLVTIVRSEHQSERLRTVHITFPGLIGALDIINESGLAMSFNQLGINRGGETHYPVFIAMRDIAESCRSFDEARERIVNMPKGMPFCIGLSSARERRSSVFERVSGDDQVLERPARDGIVCADNMAWGNRRTGEIDRIVRDRGVAGWQDLAGLLRNPKILLSCNIYSVIFDYQANKFYLASGTVPAALGEYREFTLFEPVPSVCEARLKVKRSAGHFGH